MVPVDGAWPVDPLVLAGALLVAGLIAAGAVRLRALSVSGAVAATIVGGLVLGLGGLEWALVLAAFFASSSALSQWNTASKWDASNTIAKGARRDGGQVAANGIVATLLAVISVIAPGPLPFAGFIGAMAAVTADTWATEIGLLSKLPPRMVTSGQPVRPGTSGAVTPLGSAGSAAGGIFIGLVTVLGRFAISLASGNGPDLSAVPLLVVAPVAGLTGAVADSFLGATVQAVYRCPRCEKETERAVHTCGTPTRLVRGWSWLTNDLVNLLASIVGAMTGMAVLLVFFV